VLRQQSSFTPPPRLSFTWTGVIGLPNDPILKGPLLQLALPSLKLTAKAPKKKAIWANDQKHQLNVGTVNISVPWILSTRALKRIPEKKKKHFPSFSKRHVDEKAGLQEARTFIAAKSLARDLSGKKAPWLLGLVLGDEILPSYVGIIS